VVRSLPDDALLPKTATKRKYYGRCAVQRSAINFAYSAIARAGGNGRYNVGTGTRNTTKTTTYYYYQRGNNNLCKRAPLSRLPIKWPSRVLLHTQNNVQAGSPSRLPNKWPSGFSHAIIPPIRPHEHSERPGICQFLCSRVFENNQPPQNKARLAVKRSLIFASNVCGYCRSR
jgi:hypothetical protein